MDLDNLLHAVRRRWRIVASLRAIRRALLLAAVVLFAAAVAEWLVQPGDAALLVLGAAAVIGIAAACVLSAWPLRARPADRQIARFVEERVPGLDDTLITAVDLRDRPTNQVFAPLVV